MKIWVGYTWGKWGYPMKTEADTCRTYIVPKLHTSGWDDEYITEQMVLTHGRIVPIGDRHTRKKGLRLGCVLFIRQNISTYQQVAINKAVTIRYGGGVVTKADVD